VIVAVGSDKGSPGASTLALLLGACWSSERIVVELDPHGADLAYRATAAGGEPLAASPTITTLAVDSRPGAERRPLLTYTQTAGCGVPLLVGETSAARFARIVAHLPAITGVFATAPETVIADLGRLHPTSPVLPLARAAAVTVLVSRADTASLGHLRVRVEDLGGELGGPHRLRSPLAVAVHAERRNAHAAESRVAKLLASVGSPAVVLGVMPDDPAGVAALHTGAATRRMSRSGVLAAGREIAARLRASWPELTEATPSTGRHPVEVAAGGGIRP
jgi:hypothetical protein